MKIENKYKFCYCGKKVKTIEDITIVLGKNGKMKTICAHGYEIGEIKGCD